MTTMYMLDDKGAPVATTDTLRWAVWFEKVENRSLVADKVEGVGGVSTIFLGLDHDFTGEGPPVLWETMIFIDDGSPAELLEFDGFQRRYTSRADALAGHAEALEALRQAARDNSTALLERQRRLVAEFEASIAPGRRKLTP